MDGPKLRLRNFGENFGRKKFLWLELYFFFTLGSKNSIISFKDTSMKCHDYVIIIGYIKNVATAYCI